VCSYFWEQLGSKVLAKLPQKRTLGVWLADTPNGAGGGVWPAPKLSSLPPGSFVNVYQSLESAVAPLEANVTTVVSIAGSKWYLDYHPTFEEVWKVRPCEQLNCSGHPGWSETMKGGETCMWGSNDDGKPRTMFQDAFAGGVAAAAERLWADPSPGANHFFFKNHSTDCIDTS
jgi:hypothetical protein